MNETCAMAIRIDEVTSARHSLMPCTKYFPLLVPPDSAFTLMASSQASPGSLTSSLVDDIFFILRKCGLRAMASGNVQVITHFLPGSCCSKLTCHSSAQCCSALLGELNNLIANTLRDALAGRLSAGGGPSKLLSGAPSSTSEGQLSGSGQQASSSEYTTALNNRQGRHSVLGRRLTLALFFIHRTQP